VDGMRTISLATLAFAVTASLWLLLGAVNEVEARDACAGCEHGSLCVQGRCLQLDRIERQNRANFDAACQRTECDAGEACVNGQCFSPERMLQAGSGPQSCLEIDCGLGMVCYTGVCYPIAEEVNGEIIPVECVDPRVAEDSELISYPRCPENQVCENYQCRNLPGSHIDWEKKIPVRGVRNLCPSGQVIVGAGLCVDAPPERCRQCPSGSVCLGGRCFTPTTTVGTPCENQRCPGNARCISGICVTL